MVDVKSLEMMSKKSITEMERDSLSDILDVTIVGEDPVQRLESYLSQTGNPYCFRVENTPVRLLFHNEEKTLQEKLKSYFLSLKSNDFQQEMWYGKCDYRGEMKGDP